MPIKYKKGKLDNLKYNSIEGVDGETNLEELYRYNAEEKAKLGIKVSKKEKKHLKNKLSERTILATVIILVAIPITIAFGIFVLDDRKYYFISMLIVLYTMIPFFMIFEKRKPQARELIVISVLAGIAVAGRAAFFMLPQFKPVVAVVIIAGVCFGGEAGFLVGAVSGFVSNFYFGQGPWTPWQMFAFGIIGFIAGILFKMGRLKKNTVALCIYGGITTFVVCGLILNTASVFMMYSKFSYKAWIACIISGIPFDLVHAAATVFFLAIMSRPMIEKLDRIKIKYGMVEP